MGWNLPDDVTGNEDYFKDEPEFYSEYTAKIEVTITEWGRDETEGLEKNRVAFESSAVYRRLRHIRHQKRGLTAHTVSP